MKLYNHYKNKPYKYVGEAKHSETMEDMVIYECLYNNPNGKIWVRPKGMFFEDVTVGDQVVPRFAKLPIYVESVTEVTSNHFGLLEPIIKSGLGECNQSWFESKIACHSKFLLQMAYFHKTAIGFKLGYGEDKLCFYSWLGGVLPEYRGVGVASALMNMQHDWCRAEGFAKVRTKTQNKYREMLLLNIKVGFEIVGMHSDKGTTEIILDKKIIP